MQVDDPQVQPWTVGDAKALLGVISGIASEGLVPTDYRPGALQAAIERGPGNDLDQIAGQAFAWLAEDLRDGRTPAVDRKQWFIADPDRDLYPTAEVMADALATHNIAATLFALNPASPEYAKLKQALAEATDPQSRKLIEINMDRWRWLPRDLGRQYLITNVPEYELRLVVNGQVISTYKTIVGKPGRTATPQLAETVRGVIFNPMWVVPQSIVVGEGLGKKVLNNPAWAKSYGYKISKDPTTGRLTVVQQPGPKNALGLMKLDMPNPYSIFLHDTPARSLFERDKRALSHGCIRTERAQELAITLAIIGSQASTPEERKEAADNAVSISASGKYTRVPIEKQIPVYITYFTMGTNVDGQMSAFKDIYDRDEPVLKSFDRPREMHRVQ